MQHGKIMQEEKESLYYIVLSVNACVVRFTSD